MSATSEPWPELPRFAEWEDVHTTLHMWTQIVGKIRLESAPLVNHFWSSALYLSARGITTSPMPYAGGAFAIDFDLISHVLRISTTSGEERTFPLEPITVAEFYRRIFEALGALGIEVSILARPVEVVEAIPFAKDTKHGSYNPEAVHLFWIALTRMGAVFEEFRSLFIGKASPVHLFWGALDLAATRFSGRTAPTHPGGIPNCADWVMVEAYSHEVSSAGFWAGAGFGEAAFYSYAYPSPPGFKDWQVKPEAARFNEQLGEFVMPYNAIRASNPRTLLLEFLQSTYEGSATLANWDRAALER